MTAVQLFVTHLLSH